MSIVMKPSKPFSSGTEYEIFMDSFCNRCKHGKINANGFPEYPENGGCKIWDAIECARFDKSLFPASDLPQIEADGKVKYWHICKGFETDDQDLMNAYRSIFGEGEENATD